MGIIDNTILERLDNGTFRLYRINNFQNTQSYMADGFTTIMYMYDGALFTVSCDDFQQFKVYNSSTKSCHLYCAREISLFNDDYDCKELKLFVTDRCDKYGNIILAPIVNAVHSKVAEPVKIFSVLENQKYYIRNILPASLENKEHYIEYIKSFLMKNEFIADVVDNGLTLKYHFKNWGGEYDNIVVIKNLVACKSSGTIDFLNIKLIDGKFKVVDEYSSFQDITPKQMMDLPSTNIDVNDINIKIAVVEYMMGYNICGCNTIDNIIKFNNVNIELNVVKLSYVSYKYSITCDDTECLLDEGFTEDKLYFKRIDSSDNVYTVIPTFDRLS